MAAPISLRLTFAEGKEKISLSQILTKYPKNCSAYFFLSQKVNFKISENFCLLLLSINSAPTFHQSEFPRNFPYSHAHVFLASKPLVFQLLLTELIIVTIDRFIILIILIIFIILIILIVFWIYLLPMRQVETLFAPETFRC